MTAMNFYQQIKAVERIFPELRIVPTERGFKWCFRCLDSIDEYKHGEFGSPIEALAHFAAETVKVQDEMMADEDEGEDESEDESEDEGEYDEPVAIGALDFI